MTDNSPAPAPTPDAPLDFVLPPVVGHLDIVLEAADEALAARNRYHQLRGSREQNPRDFAEAETAYRQATFNALSLARDSVA